MRLLLPLLLSTIASVVLSLAPPHPDAEHEVHKVHRSLKGGASPRLVNAALCDGLSEDECMELDREFEEQARQLRRIYQTTGYLKVLVVCVRFSNHVDRGLPTVEQYDTMFNSPVPNPDGAETGSIKNFLEANAIDRLEIDFEVMPWKTTNNTEAFYSYDKYGVTRDFGISKHAVMDQLEADGVDFTKYDLDGDGYIDAMILLHSGFQAEIGNIDCYTGAYGEKRIWSHAIANPTKRWTSPSSGIQTDNYAVGGGLRGVCRNRVPPIGVIAHEFLHNLGLPDLNDNSGEWIGRGLGHFSIMSDPYGVNNFANYPCHLTPWEKIFLGWLEPIEIDSDGTYELQDSETSTEVYIIKKNYQFNGDEYLLIENRQPKLFDALLWDGGLMIWHIDDTKRQMRERGYPGQEAWPSNNKHYQIALLSPDGRYDAEVGRNAGDASDFWQEGMEIGPGLVEPVATDAGTYPNTNSYQFGIIIQTGIRIHNISPSGDVMSFSVEGLGGFDTAPTVPTTTAPTFVLSPIPSALPTLPPTISPTPVPTPPPVVPPTDLPSPIPSVHPSRMPSLEPTTSPSPSLQPSMSEYPSPRPTRTLTPSQQPSTHSPSLRPTITNLPSGSNVPSSKPSMSVEPSRLPTSSFVPSGSSSPSSAPTISSRPTVSVTPSQRPTQSISPSGSSAPSSTPTTSLIPSQPPSSSSGPSGSSMPSSRPTISAAPSASFLLDLPNIPTYIPGVCRAAGEPCQSFLDCCSRRCNHSGQHNHCFGPESASKTEQKLSSSEGGAGNQRL